MEQNIGLFSAKLEDLAEKAALMQRHIAELESADPDEVRRARAHLEAEWADVIVELKNRAKAMRFLTGQQLSQVQLEYCRRAADILHDSLKTNWWAVAGGASKSDEAALYAEYAIDFAALAMRYALLATATALDMQYEEERNKDE